MGLLDFLTRFQDKYKQKNEIQDFKTQHPEFAQVEDTELAGALAKRYPDKYGHLAEFKPDSATPAERVPNEKRSKEFYQKNSGVAPQKMGIDIIGQVKAKYPEFKDVPEEDLAHALEIKYPDRFPKLTELVTNEKFGSITANTETPARQTPVQQALEFFAQKTGLDAYASDPKANADATMTLSKMTGIEPHKLQNMSGQERRDLFSKTTGVFTDPTTPEFTQKLVGAAAVVLGAEAPAALLQGVLKFQALHTAISQAIRAYKGQPIVDPAKAASLKENVKTGNVAGAAGDAFSILNDSDLSKLASPNATTQERDLLELLQFGAEAGVVHLATPELTAKLRQGVAEAGKATVQAARELPGKVKAAAEGATETVKQTAEVIRQIPEAVRAKLGEEKAFVQEVRAKNPNVDEAGAKQLYKEFKAFADRINAEGGGASSDYALRALTGGAVDRPVSGVVQKAGEVAKTGITDVKPTDIVSREHALIRGYETPADFKGASEAEFAKMIKDGTAKPVAKEAPKAALDEKKIEIGKASSEPLTAAEEEAAVREFLDGKTAEAPAEAPTVKLTTSAGEVVVPTAQNTVVREVKYQGRHIGYAVHTYGKNAALATGKNNPGHFTSKAEAEKYRKSIIQEVAPPQEESQADFEKRWQAQTTVHNNLMRREVDDKSPALAAQIVESSKKLDEFQKEAMSRVGQTAITTEKPAKTQLQPITVEHFNQEKAPLKTADIKVEPELVAKVNELQTKLGKQLGISSGFRTPEYNQDLKKRGYQVDDKSLHLRGRAADIPFKKLGLTQEEVVKAAHEIGLDVEDTALTPHHVHVELPTEDSPTKRLPRPGAVTQVKQEKPDSKVAQESPEKVSEKFYLFSKDTGRFTEVAKAKPITVEGVEVFVHKDEDGKGFTVTEVQTGLGTGKGKTAKEAVESARNAFKTVGAEKVKETIQNQLKRGGLSPRFKGGAPAPESVPAHEAALHPRSVAKLDEAIKNRDNAALLEALHLGNPGTRKLFTVRTGVELPKTMRETRAVIDAFAPPVKTEAKPEPVKVTREEALAKARKAQADKALDKKVRVDGVEMTKRQFIQEKIKAGYLPNQLIDPNKPVYKIKKRDSFYVVSKTQHDYANSLVDQSEGANEKTAEPTAPEKPAAPAPEQAPVKPQAVVEPTAAPVLRPGDIFTLTGEENLSETRKLIVTKIQDGRVSFRDYTIDVDEMLRTDMQRKEAGVALLTDAEMPLMPAELQAFQKESTIKPASISRDGKEIYRAPAKPKLGLKQFVEQEKAKVAPPAAPVEKAVKYEAGKRVEPWQVLEKDYIERQRTRRLENYARRLAELRAEPKQTAKVQQEIQSLEFWQKKFATYEDALKYGDTRTTYIKEVKNAISKGAAVPAEVIAQYPEFETAKTARARYEKGRHTSFGNRSIAVDDSMQSERGYKVKRQDGTEITAEQKKEIADGVSEIEEVTGSLQQIFEDADITIAHTNGTNPFLRVAGGLWIPTENTITVGVDGDISALAHEVGHALDYLAGGVLGKQVTVYGKGRNGKRLGSITSLAESDFHKTSQGNEGWELIFRARDTINNPAEVRRILSTDLKDAKNDAEKKQIRVSRISLGDYWDEPREIWARLMEQFIAYKHGKRGESHWNIADYYRTPGWWTEAAFAKLLPMVESQLNRRLEAVRGVTGAEKAIRAIGAQTDAVIRKIERAKQTGSVLIDPQGELPSTKRVNDEVQVVQSLSPDVEARWKAAKGLEPEENLVGKIWQSIKGIYQQFHEFPELPNTPAYSQIKYDLRILRDIKQIAQDKTLRVLNQVLYTLGKKKLDLFTRKVILDDLMFEAGRGHLLPFGYTAETLAADHEHITRIANQNPDVVKSLELRRTILEAIKKDLIEAGIMDEEAFKNTNYFRHQVLEYANARKILAGSKLKTPSPAYAKRRGGSELDINTDYIQAEFEWLSQALKDIEVAKVVERLEMSPLNIKKSLQKQAKEQNEELLRDTKIGKEHYHLLSEKTQEQADLLADTEVAMTAAGAMKEFAVKMGWGFADLKRLGYKLGDEEGGAVFAEVARIADEGEGEPEEAQIAARRILKAVSDRKKFIKEVLGNKFVEWQDIVPDTHEVWQPKKGNLFFSGKTIPQRLIDKLISEEGGAIGLSAADLKNVVILGGKLKEFVLPKGLVKTIEETYSTIPDSEIEKLWQLIFSAPTTFWKKWILSTPFSGRVISYNFQNMLGDLSAILGGNPQVVRFAQRAAAELWDYYYKQGSVSPELQDAIDRAVLSTELSVQEIPDINHLDVFERFNDKSFVDKVNVVKMWFAGTAKFSKWREGVLRYAAYLDYLEKQTTGDYGSGITRAFKYGASDPEQVRGLADPKDRAAQLSRDLLGDYGAISPIGMNLRKFLFPFWSWNEVNIKRYKRLFANARLEGGGAGSGDPGGARAAGAAGVAVGSAATFWAMRWAFRFAIVYLMQQAWNNLVHPDLEQDLSEYDKRRGHVIIGKNSKGEIVLRRGQDAFSDFAEWFGANSLPRLMARISNKEITPVDAGLEMAKAPVNKFLNGINPYVKTAVALLTRKTFFDDFTKPMPVRDGAATVADMFQVRSVYNALAHKPSKGLKDELVRGFVTKQDPEENAYNYILQRKGEFRAKLGYSGSGDFETPRSRFYADYKKARRFGDDEAAKRAVVELKKLGVRPKDLQLSLNAAKPIWGIPKAERENFVYKFLTQEDRRKLVMANSYYRKVFLKK